MLRVNRLIVSVLLLFTLVANSLVIPTNIIALTHPAQHATENQTYTNPLSAESTPAEIPAMRTRISRTYAVGDGGYVTTVTNGSMNYQDAQGTWQPIDNTLVLSAQTGYAWQNKANRYIADLPASLDVVPVRFQLGDAWVSFKLQEATGVGAPTNTSIRYANALPGVDIAYTSENDTFKEEITLSGPSATNTFTFMVQTSPGLTAETVSDGRTVFHTESGSIPFVFQSPFMVDAAGVTTAVAVQMTQADNGFILTYTADRAWLDNPERMWPVVIDPVVAPTDVNDDCHIANGPFVDASFCGQTTNDVGFFNSVVRRSFLRFDLTDVLPVDAIVTNAYAYLYLDQHVEGSGNLPIDVHQMTGSWTTAATWNTADGTAAWTPGGEFTTTVASTTNVDTPGWYRFYVTKLAQGWVNGEIPNQGILLKSATESTTNEVRFVTHDNPDSSKWPNLQLRWDVALGKRAPYQYETQRLTDKMQLHVNVANGNLVMQIDDLQIAGTGMDLKLTRYYNSRGEIEGTTDTTALETQFGHRWVLSPGQDLLLRDFDSGGDNGGYILHGDSGYHIAFPRKSDGSYAAPPGLGATLVKNNDGTVTLTWKKTGEQYLFNPSPPGIEPNLQAITDRNGNKISFLYKTAQTPGGATTAVLDKIIDTRGQAVTFTYNEDLTLAQMTDFTGHTWQYGYNGNKELTSSTDPENKVTHYAYVNHLLTQITTPNGNVIKIVYTDTDPGEATDMRVASVTRMIDPATGAGATTSFDYTRSTLHTDGSTRITNPNGNVTTYNYDQRDRVTKATDALGNTVSAEYDSNDNINNFKDLAGKDWKLEWAGDDPDNLIASSSPTDSGMSLDWKSVHNTNVVEVATDAQGNKLTYGYDANANPISVKNELDTQNEVRRTYNPNGTVASQVDFKGNVTTYDYDAQGNLSKVLYPSPLGAVSLTYDTLGRVATYTDGKGQQRSFSYDRLDRLIQINYADGSRISYAYDAEGNLISRTDDTGTTTYRYDTLNRIIEKGLPSGQIIAYNYDAVGNVTSFTDDLGTVHYTYNAVNQLTSVAEPGGSCTASPQRKCTEYRYDPQSERRMSMTYPNGVVVTYNYDAAGRTTLIKAVKGDAVLASFTYSYRNEETNQDTELRTSVTDKDGKTTKYTYDRLNRLTEVVMTNNEGAETARDAYTYDANGNMTEQVVNGVTTSFSYNAANQRVKHGDVTFIYDANGNLTGSDNGFALEYNAKNQTTALKHPAQQRPWRQRYAGPGQSELVQSYWEDSAPPGSHRTYLPLIQGDGAAQASGLQGGSVSFTYGLLGMNSRADATGTTYYIRDNEGNLVSERLPDGSSYYYIFDALPSVVALTDADGQVVNTYSYDPYGNDREFTGTVPNPWKYASGYHASDSAIFYHFGERFYGRYGVWTQLDPLAGDFAEPTTLNRYLYANADPINWTDPTGRISCTYAKVGGSLLLIGAGIALIGAAPVSILGALSAATLATGEGIFIMDAIEDSC